MSALGRSSIRFRWTAQGGGRRAHVHRNPMDLPPNERIGLYQARLPQRIPRSVPDAEFNEIFARLPSHRDRALVAFYVSPAPGQRVAVRLAGRCRPGPPADQRGPQEHRRGPGASGLDGCVRLAAPYQLELENAIPSGRRVPLWWTLGNQSRPLTYTRHTGCSSGPAARPARRRHCMRCGTPPPTAWQSTPASRSPMSNSSSDMHSWPLPRSISLPQGRGHPAAAGPSRRTEETGRRSHRTCRRPWLFG